MSRSAGEMPFLDHLEELRKRILRSLLAVVGCFALGLWLVDRFHLLNVLKRPIAPFLPSGQLTVLSPTEPLMIVLKLGLIVGLVLASPIILWQLWAFLSPALYEKEKKTLVPALFVGLALFLSGAVSAFLFIVPQALRVLLSFQKGSFATMITFDAYFSFVMQLVLALGLSCELPLLMIILAALGIVATPLLNRIRPYAIVGSFVLGAILSPGADVLSMFMLTIPLLLLYEIGVAGVWLVQKRRLKAEAARAAGAAAVLLCCLVLPARAQQPVLPPRGQRPPIPGQAIPGDTTRPAALRRLDSASARRLGLPSAPKRSFPAVDSIISQLQDLEGYAVTRYQSDTANVQAIDRQVELKGNAMTERAGSVLEAKAIRYQEGACTVVAEGEPHLFQGGQVLIGATARFNTCTERGVVREALTNFTEGGGNWFVRGNLAVDSNRTRLYGGNAELTSCDLPIPHYHFAVNEMKWVSKSMMVARPAVLYIRDVPIAWIPFIFQDTKPGRRSGILIPQFGFNDIVRSSRSYNRQITNIGYYWAPNDYFDAQLQLDWFSKRYVQFGVTANYRIRNRFIGGGATYSEQHQSGGGNSKSIDWHHTQQFNVSTTLNLNLSYSTNSQLVARNSIDPLVTTQDIRSTGNFTKRFPWGSLNAGLSRNEKITNGSGDLSLPTLTLSPNPIDIGRNVTWSPNVSFTNTYAFKTPLAPLLVPDAEAGKVDTTKLTGGSRLSNFNLDTPLRIGGFNLPLRFELSDRDTTGRSVNSFRVPNSDTPEPNDSINVTQFHNGGFSTTFDWTTSVQLPILFRSSWKFTPSLGIANSLASAPFAIRNTVTGGGFVHQGKRLSLGASVSPTLFAFLPGFAGFSKIRHSISPIVSYNYSPAASVSEEFARAVAGPGRALSRRSPASQSLSLQLSQNFEAKGKPVPGDTLGTSVRKIRLLSITTSSFAYDFEQAKLPGRTGWTTSTMTNQVASDLVPGFTLNVTHDLWEGVVGTDSAKFSPFLSSVSTNFSITENTLRSVGSIFGLTKKPTTGPQPNAPPANLGSGGMPLPGEIRRNSLLQPSQSLGRGGMPFSANITLNIARSRGFTAPDGSKTPGTNNSSIGLNTRFSPTRFWGLSWSTQYNTAQHSFEAQNLQLTRDLHEWRAAFNFVKSPNGNFAFYFSVFLSDFPDINYKYNQTTIRP